MREIVHFSGRVETSIFRSKGGFPVRCGMEKFGEKRGMWVFGAKMRILTEKSGQPVDANSARIKDK